MSTSGAVLGGISAGPADGPDDRHAAAVPLHAEGEARDGAAPAGESFRPLSLRFLDASLEGEFRRHYNARFLPQARLSLLLAFALYSLFGALDPWILPEATRFAWFVRFAVVDPLILLSFLLSFSRRFDAVSVAVWVILGTAAGAGLVAMMWVKGGSEDPFYYAGVMLVCTYLYCFTRIPFLPAAATSAAVSLLYMGAAVLKGGSAPSLVGGAFFLVAVNVIGAFACHAMERSVRVDFLQRRQILRQSEELRQALAEVKVLSGLIPVCAWCRKVRDDRGYWNRIEEYVASRSAATFTHGICPECSEKVCPQ